MAIASSSIEPTFEFRISVYVAGIRESHTSEMIMEGVRGWVTSASDGLNGTLPEIEMYDVQVSIGWDDCDLSISSQDYRRSEAELQGYFLMADSEAASGWSWIGDIDGRWWGLWDGRRRDERLMKDRLVGVDIAASASDEDLPTPATAAEKKSKNLGAVDLLMKVWKEDGPTGWYQVLQSSK